MAFLLESSAPAMAVENQLFAVPASFTDRWRTDHERIYPSTVLTDDGTAGDLSFYIPPSSGALLSLGDVCLELEAAIKVKDATTKQWQFIEDKDGVAPVNNLLHSMFHSVQLSLGNRLISDASQYYPYRAYLETLLRYSTAAQRSQLTSSGFYSDVGGKFNDAKDNAGEKARKALFTTKNYAQLSGKLFADLFNQTKPLIPGVPIHLRMVLSKQDFMLRCTEANKEFKVFIRNPRLYVRRYVPAPDYLLKITDQLQDKTAKYHIERTVIRVSDIAQGTQSTVVPNLQIGQLPKAMFIAFVASEDFHATVEQSPFNFQHFNVQQISVEVDGQSFPTKPYNADFDSKQYLECYDGMLDALSQKCSPNGEWSVSREDYAQGYTIFGFDLTPGGSGLGPLTLIKQGNLSVSVSFAKALAKPVMMISFMVYDSLLEINNHRQVLADFTT
jgi:hypothetical protein